MNINKLILSTAVLSVVGCSNSMNKISNQDLTQYQQHPQKYADYIVDNMNDRELIGQTLMMDFRSWGKDPYTDEEIPVTRLNDEISNMISDYHIGGVILFRQNLVNSNQIVELTDALQASSSNLPLLIATDQEGGYVTRLQNGTEMPGNMALAASGDASNAYLAGKIHGTELAALGINYNFGPVVDVNVSQDNPIIGVRSYSSNIDLINEMSTAYMDGIHDANVINALKHFPGHGNVSVDSHYDLPEVSYSRQEWEDVDLAPFKYAIEHGADSIMSAHVTLPSVDDTVIKATLSDKEMLIPATFSKPILTGILRDELGFEGLVVTDALDMGAIADNFDRNYAVKASLEAGADIALMPLQITSKAEIQQLESLYASLEDEMKANPEFYERIKEAALRVITKKLKMGLVYSPSDKQFAVDTVGSEQHKLEEQAVADAAITVIENQNNVLPVDPSEISNILVISDEDSRNTLVTKYLKQVQSETGNHPMFISDIKTPLLEDNLDANELRNTIAKSDLIILATYNLTGSAIDAQKIVDIANEEETKLVMVSTRNPYDIAHVNNVKANIAIYGITGFDVTNNDRNSLEANIRSGIRTLFEDPRTGKPLNSPHASLPVDIRNSEGEILYPFGHSIEYK
ncbi:glycoside hydrolase family 3 protein [Vibrio sp. SCSIO 43135]|uniref:glycoside hydrolase family 3 protein n=1 Tax=Vibrio sp. SCSIO 43135 TaxID=2819096 RepID=UPI002075CB5A|nr:glycoside hydrolase family 3 protein [Vibrio sp. SCSIO 43135]USD43406.1 glycoside hydrolase family 3 protein [Vibrio sp. SCSIO 43135]